MSTLLLLLAALTLRMLESKK
jgi:hypothetical protein